jgi:MFS family permease
MAPDPQPHAIAYNADMSTPPTRFTRDELSVVLGTSGAYALRMFGLYMALPVMATWVATLPHSTPLLVGLTLGGYGLTQALLQVPAGVIGDRFGRRQVVVGSLLIFAVGSAIIAMATSVEWVIIGRLVEGVGAMASTLIALIGESTRETVRTRAMALLGAVLGVAFAGGFVIGPFVSARYGVPAVFWVATALSVVGAVGFEVLVPTRLVPRRPVKDVARAEWSWDEARSILRDRSLLVLDAGISILHAALTALFVALPFVLAKFLHTTQLWRVYVPVLVLGFCSMLWASRRSDRHADPRSILGLGATLLTLGLVGLALFHTRLVAVTASLAVFVMGFAMIEPLLAALLTRTTGSGSRGTAAGVFNMCQFAGAFAGGAVGGSLLKVGEWAPFAAFAVLTFAWGVSLVTLRDPRGLVTSDIAAPGLTPPAWASVRRALIAHPAVLEADWEAGHPVRIRHWERLLSPDELSAMIARAGSAK